MSELVPKQSETEPERPHQLLGEWNEVAEHPDWYWGLGIIHDDNTLEVHALDKATGKEVVRFRFNPMWETRAEALRQALRLQSG